VAGSAAGLGGALWLCLDWRDRLEADAGQPLFIGASPFSGSWGTVPWSSVLIPVAVVALVVALGPWIADRSRWGLVLGGAAIGQIGLTAALAIPDGWIALRDHLTSGNTGYLVNVPLVGSPGAFLSGFTRNIGQYHTHGRGHPPGLILVLWLLDRVGLGGAGVAAGLCLAGGALATVAALAATRSLAGEAVARRAVPFVVLVPAAAVATNFDLVYSAFSAGALATLVLATGAAGRRSTCLAAAAGVLFGCSLLGSYGLVLFAVPVAAVVAYRRRWPLLVPFAAAAGAVLALPVAWGFWWLDGLAATRGQYFRGLGTARPGGPFAVLDLVALAAILGPAALVALVGYRDRRLLPVVGGVGFAILLALMSQMSKGEVERIWQPFVPWLVLPCGLMALRLDAARPGSWRRGRTLLAVQGAVAVGLAVFLRSPW